MSASAVKQIFADQVIQIPREAGDPSYRVPALGIDISCSDGRVDFVTVASGR